ncbi:hypothetical protein G7046_g9780 [Stylonectria norvegica]|nr:hypothetical protein G7046_g9780 [Stylonectria norvegica]
MGEGLMCDGAGEQLESERAQCVPGESVGCCGAVQCGAGLRWAGPGLAWALLLLGWARVGLFCWRSCWAAAGSTIEDSARRGNPERTGGWLVDTGGRGCWLKLFETGLMMLEELVRLGAEKSAERAEDGDWRESGGATADGTNGFWAWQCKAERSTGGLRRAVSELVHVAAVLAG